MRSIIGWTSTSTVTGATARHDRSAGHRRIGRVAAAAVTALLASTLVPMAPASAAVVWTAPLAANGFPASYDDGNVKLGIGPVVDAEAFYFGASATGGKLEVYEAALEGAYATDGVVTPGQEIVFSRLRFRVTGLDAGQSYTITHPYGVNTFLATAEVRSINETVDVGCELAPCDFNLAGAGFLGDYTANADFLKQVGAPAGTLGDPLVAHPVTGAPSGTNAVIISGPNAGGPGVNTLTVSEFAVQGQIVAAPAPTASFTTSVAAGTAPLTVAMTDTSTDIPTSWAWDLGNGTTSTVQNPSVTYAAAGTYPVTLIATNATGASAPVTQTITVTPPVTIPPTVEPTVPPTVEPTVPPTVEPTVPPTVEPTVPPTVEPTVPPTVEPTVPPTVEPTVPPTVEPTVPPTVEPTVPPTVEPTVPPTVEPTVPPTTPPTTDGDHDGDDGDHDGDDGDHDGDDGDHDGDDGDHDGDDGDHDGDDGDHDGDDGDHDGDDRDHDSDDADSDCLAPRHYARLTGDFA